MFVAASAKLCNKYIQIDQGIDGSKIITRYAILKKMFEAKGKTIRV